MATAHTLSLTGLSTAGGSRRGLRRLAALLAGSADRPVAPTCRQSQPATLPLLDFHAEAGAPEGALYVDGVLFGQRD